MMKQTKHWSVSIAMGFGLGKSPIAPGTVGTLLGIPLVGLLASLCGGTLAFRSAAPILCALLAALAIPVCDRAESILGKKDDGRIVADEYLTFPICMLGLPLQPAWFVTAFLTNRFFDIAKIPPAYQAQRLRGGLGIVLDDVIAALFSLACNHLLWWIWKRMQG